MKRVSSQFKGHLYTVLNERDSASNLELEVVVDSHFIKSKDLFDLT